MQIRLALALTILVAGSLDAQGSDSLSLRLPAAEPLRYALDCTDARGAPAQVPADYDGALVGSELEVPPRLTKLGRKEAPRGLEGQRGRVRLQFVVDTSGHVEPCTISAEEASDVRFVPSAANLILRSSFTPGEHGGRKVRAVMTQGISFF